MPEDPLDFLDAPKNVQERSNPEEALDFLEGPAWKKRKFEDVFSKKYEKKRGLLPDLATSATAIAGTPGDIASLLVGENPFTSKSLREKTFEMFPSLAPQTEKEKEWDEGLSMVMGLATPGGPLKAAGRIIGKGISKATPFLKSKYKELYQVGKDLGIPEKALAPFRQGKVSGAALKLAAKLGKEAQEGIKMAENLATPFYQKLEQAGSQIPVNQISRRGVERGLQDVIKDINKSPALVRESKDVVRFLEDAIQNMKMNPDLNVENLMALHKQLGKTVNWGSIKQSGKKHLIKESKDAVLRGIYGMNPRLGKQFSDMDRLYAGYKNLAKEVKPYRLVEFAGKGGPAGVFLISLLTGKDPGETALKAGEVWAGKKAASWISAKLMTDPKWVGIKEKVFNVIKNESFDKVPKLLTAIKKKSEKEIHKENSDPLDFLED